MAREKYTPTPEQAALKKAVADLKINYKTAAETIERVTSLLRGARLLLKNENGCYDQQNNDSVEEILHTVEGELFPVLHTMQAYEEPGEYHIILSKPFTLETHD